MKTITVYYKLHYYKLYQIKSMAQTLPVVQWVPCFREVLVGPEKTIEITIFYSENYIEIL